MKTNLLGALVAVLALANAAPAGEMDHDRPGAAPAVTGPVVALTTALPAAGSELDRESPAQACFFFRPFWGWHNPWAFRFSFFHTHSFFYRPFFPQFFAPHWGWWGWGCNPYLIWY